MTTTTTGPRWVLADTWTLTLRAFAHWARNPGPIIFSLVFNVVIVLMFAFLFGGAMTVPGGGNYREFLLPGMFVMVMLFGVGLSAGAVIADVDRGVTDRFRAMPMASSAVLAGRVIADLVLAALTLAVMVLAGLAIGWAPHGTAGDTAAGFALLLLLRFALTWVGVYLGLTMRGAEAMAAVQTAEFPFGFLSSVFVSPGTMPSWLGAIAEWNPLSSTATAVRGLFVNPGVTGDSWVVRHAQEMAVIWPVALILVFFPLSVRAYQNLSR